MRSEVVKALKDMNYDNHVIHDATQMLDPSITVSQYQALTCNRHVIKSIGFSSYRSLRACLDSAKKDPEQKKQRKAIITISAKYIMSNLKVNDQFLLDEPRNSFLKLVRDYSTPTKDERLGKTDNSVIGAIRHNCLLSAKLFLESNKNPNTLSLHDLAQYDPDQCETRSLSFKDIDKVIKTCQESKSEQDLLRNDSSIPTAFSCFLCPSASNPEDNESIPMSISKTLNKSQAGVDKATPVFQDGSIGRFNSLKARCIIEQDQLPISSMFFEQSLTGRRPQQTDERADQRADGPTYRWSITKTDRVTYRVAFVRLESE